MKKIPEEVKERIPEVKEKISKRKSIGLESFESARYFNAPNLITVTRIFLAGSIHTHIIRGDFFWALITLIFAYYTDFLDGYIARKINQVSEFGAKFDPTADKMLNMLLLNISLNGKLIFTHHLLGINIIHIITGIEITLFLTAWIFKPIIISYGWQKKIGANSFGKWKMGIESTAIIFGIIQLANWLPMLQKEIQFSANICLDFAIILGIGSIIGHYYLKNGKTEA